MKRLYRRATRQVNQLISGSLDMGLYERSSFLWAIFFLNILVRINNAQVQSTASTRGTYSSDPEVRLPHGTLRGITLWSRFNRRISAFRGIPYAQPPIGKLRFSSPVPAEPWNSTLNASREGIRCPQPWETLPTGEDCLFLNVHTPQLPGNDSFSLLPVLLWIHGGKFAMGSGDSELYGPEYLLDKDLVLVTINFRIGPLGFLSTGDEVASGNWGFKDQVLALHWVQNNIVYFGGDPDRVTIMGQSSGGAMVQFLALSNLTTNLFHKYISQSGAAFAFWTYKPRAIYANTAVQLGESLNCPTNTSSLLIDCLRELNASEIVNMGSSLSWCATDEPDIVGAFLTDSPSNLFAAGKHRDLPSMTGGVRNEAIIKLTGVLPDSEAFDNFLETLDDVLPTEIEYYNQVEDVAAFTTALKKMYLNNDLTTDKTELWFSLVDLLTDALFLYPLYIAVQKQYASAENAPYFYSFEYRGTFSYGHTLGAMSLVNTSVVHCDDLIYLFPTIEALFGASLEDMSEADIQMVDTMVQLWTSFAIDGTPTTTAMINNTTWKPYSAEGNYLRIGNGYDTTLDVQYNFLQERMQFWTELMATTSGNTARVSSSLTFIFAFLIAYRM